MIDCALTGGMELSSGTQVVDYREIAPADVKAPARTCIMDIECVDELGFPEPDRAPIICITCWDSFDEIYTPLL